MRRLRSAAFALLLVTFASAGMVHGADAATPGIKALAPGTSWNWQLDGTLNKTILDQATGKQKMMDIDMENASAADISALKAKGIVVVCYIETGSWESYRSDAGAFPASVKGK